MAGPAAAFLGILVWLFGAVLVLPNVFPYNAVAITANLVVGVGVGAGLAGWLIGLRVGTVRLPGRFDLPATVAVAIIGAWLGQTFLDDLLFRDLNPIRIKAAGEVYGAVMGGVTGSLTVPLIMGAWRVAHREEP